MELFVVCAPGLEAIAAAEVAALGLAGRAVPGGVELQGDLRTVATLNLWLRTATRVVLRLGSFTAKTFPELVHKASSLPWETALRPGAPAALRVTCRKSKLYHSDAVAERLRRAIEARLGKAPPEGDSQLFLARFDRDVCTVSADTSGELLHQRGYRLAPGPAPLRETLAAALLLAAGYTGAAPFCDPMCGAGTIAIEAALIAAGRAPGERRSFAFQRWPKAGPATAAPRAGAGAGAAGAGAAGAGAAGAKPTGAGAAGARIEASDLDPAAVAAARANAQRAGVEIELTQRALAELPPRAGAGLLATNPPYGVRVGDPLALEALFRELGQTARARRPGFRLAAVVPQERLGRALGPPARRLLETENGGLPIELWG